MSSRIKTEMRPPPIPDFPDMRPPPIPDFPDMRPPPIPDFPDMRPPPIPDFPDMRPPPIPDFPDMRPPPIPDFPDMRPPPIPDFPDMRPQAIPNIPAKLHRSQNRLSPPSLPPKKNSLSLDTTDSTAPFQRLTSDTFDMSQLGASFASEKSFSSQRSSSKSLQFDTMSRDTNFVSMDVKRLSVNNFEEFIKSKEKALIFFYNGTTPRKTAIENAFSDAADLPLNPHYGFGAIDCHHHKCFCMNHVGNKTPSMKLFSNGFEISTMTDIEKFTTTQMQMLMKMTPVLTQPRAVVSTDDMEMASEKPTKKRNIFSKLFKKDKRKSQQENTDDY